MSGFSYTLTEVNNMKRIIEYFKDIQWWVKHYPQGWWHDKAHRKTAILNALYCTAPAHWKRYNRLLNSLR